jgi:hypothetical protein
MEIIKVSHVATIVKHDRNRYADLHFAANSLAVWGRPV